MGKSQLSKSFVKPFDLFALIIGGGGNMIGAIGTDMMLMPMVLKFGTFNWSWVTTEFMYVCNFDVYQ